MLVGGDYVFWFLVLDLHTVSGRSGMRFLLDCMCRGWLSSAGDVARPGRFLFTGHPYVNGDSLG